MGNSELVTNQHRSKKALIYVRQSTPQQVLSNRESLELQRALKNRAIELGWRDEDIETIEDDLGLTAVTAEHREGFKNMVARVTLGQVGIILFYELSRLIRNCTDLYPVLDVCGYRNCLIADRDSIYNPNLINDRLVLGLRGQVAEVEMSTIRARLDAGVLNKAKRGELIRQLPAGFIHDECDLVQKDSNLEVQTRIELVFDTFLRVGSASKTLRYLNEHKLSIPRYDKFGEVLWKRPTTANIISILKNPAYAGTYAYGRSEVIRTGPSPIDKKIRRLPMDQWKIVIHDKFPSYITWETFKKIQAMLKDNHTEYDRNKTRGVPRNGAALLHGLVYCGECGHKMVVQYKTGTRYLCNYLRQQHGVPVCQYIPADPIDNQVVEAFFEALSPIELNAYEQAINAHREADQRIDKARKQQLERLRYHAQLAERQFNRSDPDNRLVTAELERRWEDALREVKKAEEELQEQKKVVSLPVVDSKLKAAFLDIGKKLPEVWSHPAFSREQKKAFLRCLIDKVIIHRKQRDCIELRIVWQGHETTNYHLPIRVGSFAELSSAKEMESLVIEMAKAGNTDQKTAEHLTQLGHRSPMRDHVLPSTVQNIRLKNGILLKRHQSHPTKIDGLLTVTQISRTIRVPKHWIYDRINNGSICINKEKETGYYLFPDNQDTIRQFRQLKAGKLNSLNFS